MILCENHWLYNEPRLMQKLPLEVWVLVFQELHHDLKRKLQLNLNLIIACKDDQHTTEPTFSYSCWQRYIVKDELVQGLLGIERGYIGRRINSLVKRMYRQNMSLQDVLNINYQITMLKALLHKTNVFHKKFTYCMIQNEIVLHEINTYYIWNELRCKRFQEY